MSADPQITPEVERFLSEGTRTGMLAYTATDGRPLVAPVWFIIGNGEIVLMTGKTSAKGRALTRDPRATLCVDEPHAPYGFVQIQGIAVLSEDPRTARHRNTGRRPLHGRRASRRIRTPQRRARRTCRPDPSEQSHGSLQHRRITPSPVELLGAERVHVVAGLRTTH
ncbi:pyridoxamine 5'-phosphate oxidase family protein [Mycolicibacterium sediminis]|uniref:pyridoxamine 5'-phosphate oxidase family protein n=2 Tax=Mycolicibacterium sediminis TaxID=1286180 RepID=UPI003CD0672D